MSGTVPPIKRRALRPRIADVRPGFTVVELCVPKEYLTAGSLLAVMTAATEWAVILLDRTPSGCRSCGIVLAGSVASRHPCCRSRDRMGRCGGFVPVAAASRFAAGRAYRLPITTSFAYHTPGRGTIVRVPAVTRLRWRRPRRPRRVFGRTGGAGRWGRSWTTQARPLVVSVDKTWAAASVGSSRSAAFELKTARRINGEEGSPARK